MTAKSVKTLPAMLYAAAVMLMASPAHSTITISSEPTENMSCVSGVCVPTSTAAILNASDLQTMLAAGNLTVKTTGANGVEASDIFVEAKFSWKSTNALTLDAYRGLTVDKPVADAGPAALGILTNDGGTGGYITFRYKGRIHFTSIKNALTINGQSYKLVKDVASLAAAVAKKSDGFYALADNYDASKDGTYTSSPVPTGLEGTVQGLGNAISNISMKLGREEPADERAVSLDVGFFAGLSALNASVQSLTLHNINMTVLNIGKGGAAGGLAGFNVGQLYGDHVDGMIQSKKNTGGLVGVNAYLITRSSAAVTISEMAPSANLVFESDNLIVECFANGMSKNGEAGLVGNNVSSGSVKNSYATAAIKGAKKPTGGFVGSSRDTSSIDTSYSTGSVKGGRPVGGFAGESVGDASISSSYWDKQTSGQKTGVGSGDNSGVTGLTTAQFKSGLPAGFDPAIWAQDKKINNGYPYLIMNPPPK